MVWEWEWERMEMYKAIPDHLYRTCGSDSMVAKDVMMMFPDSLSVTC